MILKPTDDNCLNTYVDSDFTGMWSHATSQLHDSTVSHTSYIITYCGCPIHWVSKLQSEIAFSTTKAEYIALSMCLCNLLPMHTLLTELTRHFNFGVPSDVALAQHTMVDTHMHQSMIFEDNTGCLELANKPDLFHPQTKHISIKWCFLDAVKNGSVVVQKIDTTLQLANPLKNLCHAHGLSNCNDFSWVGNTFLIKNASSSLFTTCFLFLHHGFLLHLFTLYSFHGHSA